MWVLTRAKEGSVFRKLAEPSFLFPDVCWAGKRLLYHRFPCLGLWWGNMVRGLTCIATKAGVARHISTFLYLSRPGRKSSTTCLLSVTNARPSHDSLNSCLRFPSDSILRTMPQTEHLEWLAQQESHAITAFVIEFQYTDRGQAYAEYEELVLSSHLKGPARKRILEDFESWKRNESRVEMFWLGRESHMAVQKGEKVASTNLIKAATKGLPNTIIQGSATAELSEPVSSRTSAAATATNGGLVASSSITATTSAFYDPKSPFLDTSTPAPSPKGTPTEAESDDVQAQSDARARKRGRMDSVC
ncbi:hypothetical protein B0O80DRAFT_133594 [Mortierella sp. GBAus27b]|nr:hypothetical protein B0O80DRAFT_133594 [Mortierella sp. GBAus27b]